MRGSSDIPRALLRSAQSGFVDLTCRVIREYAGKGTGAPRGARWGLQEQAGPQAEEAALGLTRAMLAMAAAMKMALKIQIEDGLVRSINWPARIGPVMAAADEAK